MQLVPARPLVVKTSFTLLSTAGSVAMILLGIAAGAGFFWMESADVQDLVSIAERWERAQPTEARVGGDVTTSNFIFSDYELDVTYLDLGATERTVKYEFTTLFGGPDVDEEISVRVAADRPDAPIVSWAVEYTGARWCAVVFLILAGALISVGLVTLGWAMLSKWRSASLAGVAATEVHCPVLEAQVTVVQGNEMLAVTYRIPEDADVPVVARGVTHKANFKLKKRRPLMTADDALVVLVPRDRPTAPVPMTEDFHPYALSPGQKLQYEDTRRTLPAA
jgi:hypothetical protein